MRLLDNNGMSIGCGLLSGDMLKALTQERLGILKLLSEKPHYPAELARVMGMEIHTIYYHIRILEKAGLIEFEGYQEKNGGIAKRYQGKTESLGIVLRKSGWKESSATIKEVPRILAPFVGNGFFDGLIVVGSPEPHGKYRARASEFGIAELAMLLGTFAPPSFPLYALDTQVLELDRKRNLILAGGPKVNTLVAEINGALPVRYSRDFAEVFSSVTGKRYTGNIGIIELIPNPDASGKHILAIGGLNHHGTRASVLAMIRKIDDISKKGKLSAVVEGFDEDGDGRVDSVEILE